MGCQRLNAACTLAPSPRNNSMDVPQTLRGPNALAAESTPNTHVGQILQHSASWENNEKQPLTPWTFGISTPQTSTHTLFMSGWTCSTILFTDSTWLLQTQMVPRWKGMLVVPGLMESFLKYHGRQSLCCNLPAYFGSRA